MDHTQGVSLPSCQIIRRAIFAATDGRSVGFLVSQNLLLHFKAVQCRRSHWHLFELCLVTIVSINRVLCFIEGLLLPNCRGGRKPWHEAQRSTKAFIGLHHQAPYLGSARPVKFFHTDWIIISLWFLSYTQRHCHVRIEKGPVHNCCYKIRSTQFPSISLYA